MSYGIFAVAGSGRVSRTQEGLHMVGSQAHMIHGSARFAPLRTWPGLPQSFRVSLAIAAALFLARPGPLRADDLEECRAQFLSGQYRECISAAADAIKQRHSDENWYVLKAQAELAIGEYSAAEATVEAGLRRHLWSVQLRLVGYHASRRNGHADRAQKRIEEINERVGRAPRRYTDVENLVVLGQVALLQGADASRVLEALFDQAKKRNPDRREPYLASAQLALDKHDHQLAAEIYAEAAEKYPNDPDVQFGLARAYADSDAQRSAAALQQALRINPNHVPSLLFRVDQLVDSEQYAEARKVLDRIFSINPRQPRAWAYRAVLAQLRNDPEGEKACRTQALGSWKTNPAVDHLIGKKLSQKYRFAEGAAYQRQALEFDPDYLPAQVQLAQDLLRLGQEDEGWKLAQSAFDQDSYDVLTYNLLELRDRLAQFRTLEDEDFLVRMEAREAAIYGERVLALLHRAKATLCEKYGLELDEQITVEIFPRQNDFSVRTFGMPAVSGFLGVCFGKVITANSPASQRDAPTNWESVLWHEFCHVVTLELTHNKMPRWLSEGISVYEEQQANPGWGQPMTPDYRERILEGKLTPISELSGAFLSPESPSDLQFAYYESALVVAFLIERFGLDSLKQILHDLGAGVPVNQAIERRTTGLGRLEEDFEQFARQRAEQLAPQVDWKQHDLAAVLNDDGDLLSQWIEEHPTNFFGLTLHAQRLIQESQWTEAKSVCQKLIDLHPDYTGEGNAYEMLAAIHRKLNETSEERAVLKRYARLDADAVNVYIRLMELERQAEDWQAVQETVDRMLAVDPLRPQPYRFLAEAAEKRNQDESAMAAYRALLELEPADPAQIHYRLARLLHRQGDSTARRHVVMALEEAPRYRDAHRLLLNIVQGDE